MTLREYLRARHEPPARPPGTLAYDLRCWLTGSVSDWWLGFQGRTADRIATRRCRSRARFWGEVFALTGEYGCRWPGRYTSAFVDGNLGEPPPQHD
jgi:hypothetical protein